MPASSFGRGFDCIGRRWFSVCRRRPLKMLRQTPSPSLRRRSGKPRQPRPSLGRCLAGRHPRDTCTPANRRRRANLARNGHSRQCDAGSRRRFWLHLKVRRDPAKDLPKPRLHRTRSGRITTNLVDLGAAERRRTGRRRQRARSGRLDEVEMVGIARHELAA